MNNPKIVFMATPEFAVPTLESVHEKFGVSHVVTLPDKPKGRGQKLIPTPIKQKAEELAIPVIQPELLKDPNFIKELEDIAPDIILVLAFRILPEAVYSIAKIATFNIHGSLLPKYRGAAPINWAIINGDKQTGLTSFILKKKVDTGDMLMQDSMEIPENFTAGDLHNALMPMSAKLAVSTIDLLKSGEYSPYPQQETEASPAPKLFRDGCKAQWNQHARTLRNFIHGVSPIPGAWTDWDGKRLKILRSEYTACGVGNPGEFHIVDGKLLVQCGKGVLSLTEIQPQGKKVMLTSDFLKGYRGESQGKFE
jgi:methionyl-tRNA formyltransferase